MADEDPEVLYVDGQTFDTDDLTYGERIQIRHLVKNELWLLLHDDEEFDWEEVTPDHVMAATILVFLRRSNPAATIDEALACKPVKVMSGPPTKPSPKRSSSRAKASATAGSQS